MRTNFTPGPWEANKQNSNEWIVWGKGQAVAIVQEVSDSIGYNETKSNAQLTESAPALFEMLQTLWVNIPSHIMEEYGIKEEEVTAVLSKAAGA